MREGGNIFQLSTKYTFRDGEMFKHILNFMRTGRPILPDNFGHLELLLEEARYYELQGKITQRSTFQILYLLFAFCQRPLLGPLGVSLWPIMMSHCACISDLLATRLEREDWSWYSELVTQLTNLQNKTASLNNGNIPRTLTTTTTTHTNAGQDWEVVALNVSPEMGERIMISGVRDTIEEVFPEISHTLQDTRHSLAWNSTSKYVIRSVENPLVLKRVLR